LFLAGRKRQAALTQKYLHRYVIEANKIAFPGIRPQCIGAMSSTRPAATRAADRYSMQGSDGKIFLDAGGEVVETFAEHMAADVSAATGRRSANGPAAA